MKDCKASKRSDNEDVRRVYSDIFNFFFFAPKIFYVYQHFGGVSNDVRGTSSNAFYSLKTILFIILR